MVTNKKHQVTAIVITFSGQVNTAEADSAATYRLATPGSHGSYTAKNAKTIKLRSANYNSSSETVTLTPKSPFKVTKPVQILVSGLPPSGLRDGLGRLIDGDHNGTTGGNATAILTRGGASIAAVSQVSVPGGGLDTSGRSLAAVSHGPINTGGGTDPAMVDALVELDALATLVSSPRSKHRRD